MRRNDAPPPPRQPLGGFRLIPEAAGRYSLQGDLTFATVSAALEDTSGALGPGGARLVFDLGGIDRADSAGVALMIEWLRRAEKAGSELRFIRVPESLQAIIRVSGVEKLLPAASAGT